MAGPSSASFLSSLNAEYVDAVYQTYRQDPNSVDEKWRYFFEGFEFASRFEGTNSEAHVNSKVESYINLIRRLGHLSAHLNPLDQKPSMAIELQLDQHGLGDIPKTQLFHPANLPNKGPQEWGSILDMLYTTYCGSIGADFRDIPFVDAMKWFQNEMESCQNQPVISKQEKLRIFEKLVAAEGFERFLGDRFLGQKRFSIEGLESLMPLMDFLTADACLDGLEEICIGMAHRGRLNILANYMGKPYEQMLKEFEGSNIYNHNIDGDVKYHMGYANYITTLEGERVRAYLLPNPSHLEAVYPVVEGFTAARQQDIGDVDRQKVLPLLMHGDAAFSGQGVVAETLNLSMLDEYRAGGSVHIILNNQVGFTTDPRDSRSSPFAADIAKIVRAPILSVNADDPEAVVWAGELALRYRQKFKRDVVIELVGYRRHGHNETDEPSFTQPHMYRLIKDHPTVLAKYGQRLMSEGVITQSEYDEKLKGFRDHMQVCLDRVRSGNFETLQTVPRELAFSSSAQRVSDDEMFRVVETKIGIQDLKQLTHSLVSIPKGFEPHPKIKKLFAARQAMIEGEGAVDWGLAELLAYGAIAKEGHRVRLSGQDCQRGTFSHRHAVVRDFKSSQIHNTLAGISSKQGSVTIVNSPLSEMGVLGFEFGFSVGSKNTLVLWEAQFGDFCNGAQIIIDQFLAASEAKWRQVCNLILLLPHGYEGMGPEHSSARPERFLQLCGDNNIQLANPTQPAQLFHLFRRQVLRPFLKPLVILSPKSLLRHPKVISTLKDFSESHFVEVIDDPGVDRPQSIDRVVFCTGKIYYELAESKAHHNIENVALVRIEQLYPFPDHGVAGIMAKYAEAKEVLWVQEEPSNMGFWTFVRHRIKRIALKNATFRYSGRKSAGTTAEGSVKSHKIEQSRIIQDALGLMCPVNPDYENDAVVQKS